VISRPPPPDAILGFHGLFAYLSNYYEAPITLQGPKFLHPLTFPTNEHAFAAMKTLDFDERKRIAELGTPGLAKKAGRAVQLRPEWDNIRVDVMRHLVRVKFEQNHFLADLLLRTGDRLLVEGNTWGDRWWGVDIKTLEGENWLGRVLMEERQYRLELTATTLSAGSRGNENQLGFEGLAV
jgi:ribA/ribD-fused uncharacterized protein